MRDAGLDFQPGRLWSLWDMLKLDASAFHDAMGHLLHYETLIQANSDRASTDVPVADEVRPLFKQIGERLLTELEVLQTPASQMRVQRLIATLDNPGFTFAMLAEAIDDIRFRLKDELTLISVYVLDCSKAKYFENDGQLFGKEVADKFPSAAHEVDESGKCFAVHRATACVFHLMRVMKIGVRATARCLGIADPLKPAERNWGFILGEIKKAIDVRWPAQASRQSGDGAFFEGLYASLDAVRNPWRNATMHVENKYTDEEAEHIFVAVRGFTKKLASRLDEQGKPLA